MELHKSKGLVFYVLANGASLLEGTYSVGEGLPDFSWVTGPFENIMKACTPLSWKRHISACLRCPTPVEGTEWRLAPPD